VGILDSILKMNIDEMKARRDFEGLFGALNNKRNVYIRRDAAKALGEIGDATAMEPLKDVRDAAVEAIAKIAGDPRAVVAFVEPLKNGNSIAREEAASSLGKIRHKSAVEHLIPALKDEDCFVRQSAAASLGKIGEPTAVEALAQTLKDEDKDVRQTAAIALGEIGGAAAVEFLVQSLKDESIIVRYRAVESLGRIGGSSAVDALIGALNDRGWIELPAGEGKSGNKKAWVRQKAIEALAKIGDARAVAPITEALNDKQEVIRQAAQKALQKLGAGTTG
jgi:HEAT repeat protein